MYNGIGLQTARGSGTNGYVQKNIAMVRNFKDRIDYKSEEELKKLDAHMNKAPNKEIMDHERKRKVELKCMEMQELMEEQGYTTEEIERKVSTFRRMLIAKEGVSDRSIDTDEMGRPIAKETHQVAEATQAKNDAMKAALGISEYFKDGSSFDPERRNKEEQEKAVAMAMKKYSIMRESSESKSPSPEKKSKKKKKKSSSKRSRTDSESSDRREHNKKKKKKKRKHHDSSEDDSEEHSSSDSDADESQSKKSKRHSRRKRSGSAVSSDSDTESEDTDSDSSGCESLSGSGSEDGESLGEEDDEEGEDEENEEEDFEEESSDSQTDHTDSSEEEETGPEDAVDQNKAKIPVESPRETPSQNCKNSSHDGRKKFNEQQRSVERDQRWRGSPSSSAAGMKRGAAKLDGGSGGGGELMSKRGSQTARSGDSNNKHGKHRRQRSTRSSARSSRERRRKNRRKSQIERKRTRTISSSHSHHRSHSSRSRSRSRVRSTSRSPSIRRRKGSPSHLERRRITSARKRPVPYHRASAFSSDSEWSCDSSPATRYYPQSPPRSYRSRSSSVSKKTIGKSQSRNRDSSKRDSFSKKR